MDAAGGGGLGSDNWAPGDEWGHSPNAGQGEGSGHQKPNLEEISFLQIDGLDLAGG
jgi:hypothetical protein